MSRRPDPRFTSKALRKLNERVKPIYNRPADVTSAKPLPLQRRPLFASIAVRTLNAVNQTLEGWKIGECSVIITREHNRYHLSIAHPDRLPTWNEISQAWYRLCAAKIAPGHVGALILPQLEQYTNLHPHCMQVLEIPALEEDI